MSFSYALSLGCGRWSRLIPLALFAALLGSLGIVDATEPEQLSLAACYQRALETSETIGLRQADIKLAEARYRQALAPALPQLSATGTFSYQNNPSGAPSSVGGTSRTRDRLAAGFTATQILFNGFRELHALGAAGAERRARGHELKRHRENLYLTVSEVFYQILALQRDLTLIHELRTTLVDRVAELERRVELGRSRQGDLLAARAEAAAIEVLIEQTAGLLGASEELMAFLINRPRGSWQLHDATPFPSAPDLHAYVQHAAGRSDVLAAVERRDGAAASVQEAQSRHLPTVAAQANYFAYDNPAAEREWNVLLTVSVPIFDGGLIAAQVAERRTGAEVARLNLAQLQRSSNLDVRTAHNNFVAQARQFFRLTEAAAVQEQNYHVQREDYEIGRASNLDVLQALTQWQETLRQRVATESQARITWVALQVAAGSTAELPVIKK